MKKIGHGAEAEIFKDKDIVVKKRIKKGYRHPNIDTKIRRERTKKEARLLQKIRGLRVPRVNTISEFEFSIEFIKGDKLKDLPLKDLSKKIGEVIGKLHDQGIYHGDLTTSNMILENDDVVLIDFGLANRGNIEDFATDLKVLFEVASATHNDFSRPEFFSGYSEFMKKEKEVKKRLEKVYTRGRYLKTESRVSR
ncbi:MAG: Kae1-associated serine/threonine protein kinase [Candidatus Altiarchaeota archaeon]|nr:Kae1-associated serine/threonine protein kinase [Candidatus Altiarchaeota archaeon]